MIQETYLYETSRTSHLSIDFEITDFPISSKLELQKFIKISKHLELLPRPLGQDWSGIWVCIFGLYVSFLCHFLRSETLDVFQDSLGSLKTSNANFESYNNLVVLSLSGQKAALVIFGNINRGCPMTDDRAHSCSC